jgi:hypothetical protein
MLKKHESVLVAEWIKERLSSGIEGGRIKESELREQCATRPDRSSSGSPQMGVVV